MSIENFVDRKNRRLRFLKVDQYTEVTCNVEPSSGRKEKTGLKMF